MKVCASAYSLSGIRNSFALTFSNCIVCVQTKWFKPFLFFLILLIGYGKAEAQTPVVHVQGTSMAITSSHPDSCHFLTPCYDQIELTFEIDSLVTNSSANSPIMALDFPVDFVDFDTAFFVLDTGLPTCTRSNSLTSIDNGSICQTRLVFDSLYNCMYFGTWTVRFRINDCAIYSATDFSMDFNLLLMYSEQEMDVEPSGGNLTSEKITETNAKLSLNLNKSSIEIDTTGLPLGMYTQNGNLFTKLDVVDRYYKIQTQEGIVDYFKLRMNVEEDAEIMLIEAMDGNNSDSSMQIIFNNSVQGAGLQGGSVFNVVFGDTYDSSIYIPSDLAPVTSNLISVVGVNMKKCLTQVPFSSNDSVLFQYTPVGSPTVRNYILIHERLRLRELANCENVISTTAYQLDWYCKNDVTDVDSLVSCQNSSASLDIGGSVFADDIKIGQYVDSSGHYIPIPSTGALGICSSSSSINYAVVIKNMSHSAVPNIPTSSGTISLEGLRLQIDRNYFDYDSIFYGTQFLDTASYSRYMDVGGIEVITIRDSAFATNVNPNLLGDTLGVDSILHGYFPLSGSESFKYLPVGHQVGFVFHNLVFRGDRDSSIRASLQQCGKEVITLLRTSELMYKNTCHIEDTIDQNLVEYGTLLINDFNGYPISSSDPQDVGTMGDTSFVSASFTQTSTSISAQHPWQLSYVHNPVDLFSCPNKSYGAIINLPSSNFSLPDTIYYTDPLDTTNTTHISSPFLRDTLNNYQINFPAITSPNVALHFTFHIVCQDTISGPASFIINFIEICDTNCRDCYMNYGCTDFVMNLHCNGECQSSVQTTEFKMERKTFGWESYANWDTAHAVTPSAPPAGVAREAWYKYYPFDVVHVESLDGKTGSDSARSGLPNLDSLFFDMSFDPTAFPVNVNPLVLINGTFTIHEGDSANPCLPIVVDVDSSDVYFIMGDSTHSSIIRVSVDLSDTTLCTGQSLLDVIQASDSKIDFSGDFYFKDLGLSPSYYAVANITGQYSCVESGVFSGSCDPYIRHLTYLQIKPEKVRDATVGARGWTYGGLSQCQFVHEVNTKITGGYPDGDDFLGEYRPVLVYPDTFALHTSGNEFSYTNGYYGNFGYCSGNYNFVSSGNDTVDLSGTTCELAIEKTSGNNQQLVLTFEKDCALTNNTSDSLTYDGYVIQKFAYISNCVPCGNFSSDDSVYHYQNLLDIYNVDIAFNPPGDSGSPYIGLKNPTDDIGLSITFNPVGFSFSSSIPNSYLYFKDLNFGDQLVSVVVKDSGVAIVPVLVGTDSVYDIGSLVRNTPRLLTLTINWKQCGLPDSVSYDDLLIRARVIHACSDTLNPLDINACGFVEDTFNLRPEKANVTLVFDDNDSLATGCAHVFNDFHVQSLGSSLKDAFLDVVIPSNMSLVLGNCTIDTSSVPLAPSLVPPILRIDSTSIPNFRKYTFNLVDYIPLGDFYRNSPHESIPVHLEARFTGVTSYPAVGLNSFNFTYSVTGVSGCLDTVREVNQTFQYDYTNPPVPITITGTNKICSTNDSLHSVTLTASHAGGVPTGCSWTGSGYAIPVDTNIFNAVYPGGLYTVTAISDSGCTLYATKFLNDSTPIISITSRMDTIPCIASPDTLMASAVPCTGCNYVWSTGATTTSIGIAPVISSVYTVTVTNSGCVASATQPITIASYSCCGTYTNDLTQGDISSNDTIPMGNYNLVPPAGLKIIHITDTLYISPGTNIAIPNNVKIIVDRGVLLTLDSVYLFSCGDSLWQGIDLDPDTLTALYTSIIVHKSRIENAVIGIHLNRDNYSSFKVDLSTFDQNYIDIQAKKARSYGDYSFIKKSTFTCTQTLKHPYSGKLTDIHIELERFDLDNAITENFSGNYITKGTYGVKAYNGCLVNSYRNTYYALDKGFDLSYNCELLAVDRNQFLQCTTGIRANDGCVLTVEDENVFNYNTNGIWASVSTALYVGTWGTPNYFSNCWNSITASTNCDPVYIENNDIKDLGYLGIYSTANSGSTQMIRKNYIHNSSSTTNKCKGIYVLTNASLGTYNITVFRNTIENIGNGIHLSGSTFVLVQENLINLPINTLPGSLTGIQLDGSDYCKIKLNEVYGDTSIADTLSASISVYLSIRAVLSCNRVENTYKGLTLLGNTSGAKLYSNVMKNCFYQFHLGNNNPGIGGQGNVGTCDYTNNNIWYAPATGGIDCYAEQTSNLGASPTEFVVSYPSIFVPDTSIAEPGSFATIITVSSGTPCGLDPVDDPRVCDGVPPDDQDRAMVDDFQDALRIAKDTSLMIPENEAIKWLDQDYLLKLATDNPSFTLNPSIDSAKTAIEQTTIPTFNLLDEMLVAHSDTLQNTLLADSTSNLDSLSLVLANQSAVLNDGIVPVLQLETNEKNVNEIYLNTIFLGIYSFTQPQIVTLRTVAEQCPNKGGTAVFKARGMLMFVDSVVLDYPDVCLGSNARIGSSQSNINELQVNPNPSNGQFIVSWHIETKSKYLELEVMDVEGRIIKKSKISSNLGSINCDLRAVSSGVYLIRILDENHVVNYKKAVINR